MAEVDFYYSIGSRYSYLATTQLSRLEDDTGCTIVWRPVNGPRLIARRADDPFANPSPTGQYAPEYRARDLARWAAHYGVVYVEPTGRVRFDSQEIALACTAALRLGAEPAVSRGLFAAMYEGAVTLIDADACARVAAGCAITCFPFERCLRASGRVLGQSPSLGLAASRRSDRGLRVGGCPLRV